MRQNKSVAAFVIRIVILMLSSVVVNNVKSVITMSEENLTDDSSVVEFAHESCQTETLSGQLFNHFYNAHNFANGNGVIELLVRFKGVSDGHLILTASATDDDPLYMIVLGSYENTLSEIRRSKWGENVFKMKTPSILSEQQFRGFVIRYNQNKGELWVYSEGSEMPLLHWKDPEPLDVQYFSFSAYDEKVVQVAFHCKPKDEHSIISPVNPKCTGKWYSSVVLNQCNEAKCVDVGRCFGKI